MRHRRWITAAVMAGALTTGLAACSGSESTTSSSPAASTLASGSAADVAFAQSMIPHHQQAVEMADLALDSKSQASPEVKALATQIQGAQDPEIQEMSTWLAQWGAPSAMPGAGEAGDMSGMDHSGHDMGGVTMSGMMTAEDMQALGQASGAEFDTMWMQMMIAHHEGAVQMAEQVKAASDNPEVTALADKVITAQNQEIATMKDLLAS